MMVNRGWYVVDQYCSMVMVFNVDIKCKRFSAHKCSITAGNKMLRKKPRTILYLGNGADMGEHAYVDM